MIKSILSSNAQFLVTLPQKFLQGIIKFLKEVPLGVDTCYAMKFYNRLYTSVYTYHKYTEPRTTEVRGRMTH